MSRKLVFIVNKPEREAEVLRWLAERILSLDTSVQVRIIDKCSSEMLVDLLIWRPNLVVTYPFTGISLASPFYILKYLLKCQIVCLRTEGVYNIRFAHHCLGHVGIGKYGADLVDYEIFWGPLSQQEISNELKAQDKISSLDRCVTLGSPYLDIYFNEARLERYRDSLSNGLLARLSICLGNYKQKYLILTAFHYADYTDSDFFAAGDLIDPDRGEAESAKRLLDLKTCRRLTKEFRDKLIEEILIAATKDSSKLFIVKLHPCEVSHYKRKTINPYQKLESLSNVLVLSESIRIGSIIEISDVVLHYGSTASYESYLLGKPSYFIRFKALSDFLRNSKIGGVLEPLFSSELEVSLENIHEVFGTKSDFKKSEEVQKHLELLFDVEDTQSERPYKPLDKIAQFLLNKLDSPNPVPLNFQFNETQKHLEKWSEPTLRFLIDATVKHYVSGEVHQSIELLKLLEKLSNLLNSDFLDILDVIIKACSNQGYPSAFLDYQSKYIESSCEQQNVKDVNRESVIYF